MEEQQLHLQQSKEELAKCEREVTELERRLEEKEMEVQVISKQVSANWLGFRFVPTIAYDKCFWRLADISGPVDICLPSPSFGWPRI